MAAVAPRARSRRSAELRRFRRRQSYSSLVLRRVHVLWGDDRIAVARNLEDLARGTSRLDEPAFLQLVDRALPAGDRSRRRVLVEHLVANADLDTGAVPPEHDHPRVVFARRLEQRGS